MNICVIGAGIVGCSTAYQLVLQGHQVQLIDAAEGPGQGASLANGAQLSYSYVEPLASPHTLRSLPGMLMSLDSPLRFSLQSDWRQWAWGLQFLTACTQRKVQAGTRTLLQLSQRSQQVLAQWMAQEQWFIDFQRNGKLVLCPDTASLDRQRQQIDFQRALGCDQTILSVDECLTREPALQRYRHQFAGAVWTADECIADPHKLCQALLSSTLRKNATASFRTQLQGFVTRGDRVQAVRTSQGEIQADAFVLATGSSVSRHAALLGVYLPVYPIKGYSITVPIRVTANAPKVSVTDLARKTVFAPLDGRLRVAARAEIIGYDLDIPQARIQGILDSVEAVFPGVCALDQPASWAGLRPATPTSIPIIGRRKHRNLFFNTGHGALGLTLAAGSAAALAQAMSSVEDERTRS